MIDKPLTEKLVDLFKEVIKTLKGETDEEIKPAEPTTDENKDEEEKEEEKESIEPELNGGFAGF